MKKRILSGILSVLLAVMSFPMFVFSAADEAEATDMVITETGFPDTVLTEKTANNFPAAAHTFNNLQCEGNDVDPGIAANKAEYVYLSGDGNAELTENRAEFSSLASGSLRLLFKALPNAESNILSVHIDTTAWSNNIDTRIVVGGGSGSVGSLYAIGGQTVEFIPDADSEASEKLYLKTTGDESTSIWNVRLNLPKGLKGTLYLPETLFADKSNQSESGGKWGGDYSNFNTDWHLTDKWNHSAFGLGFDFLAGTGGEVIVFSDLKWVTRTPFSLDYNAKYTDIDFSDAEKNASAVGGSYGSFTHETADSKWKHTVTGNYTPAVYLNRPFSEGFDAFFYEIDTTGISSDTTYQVTYNVYDKRVSGSKIKRRYIVANGPVYLVWENGSVTTLQVGSATWKWPNFQFPSDFKGTVIVPFDTFKTCEHDVSSVGADGYENNAFDPEGHADLFKTDDITHSQIIISTGNNPSGTIIYDSLGMLAALKPSGDGRLHDDSAPLEMSKRLSEDANTVEMWVKTPINATAGILLADKYFRKETSWFKDGENGYFHKDSIRLEMNAAGSPCVTLNDGEGTEISLTADETDIRNGKWTHLAFVKDVSAGKLRLFINGAIKATEDIPHNMDEVLPYHRITVGHGLDLNLKETSFVGEIADLRFWNDARTSEELLNYCTKPIDGSEQGLISAYSLDTQNGLQDICRVNDIRAYDLEITANDDEYTAYDEPAAYSMAVIPDTQIANILYDAENSDTGFDNIAKWIIENKERQNIKFVMGLGDITDKNTDDEWSRAAAMYQSLENAGLPYSVITGNHDYEGASVGKRDSAKFNTAFSSLPTKGWFGGSKEKGKLDNAYYYLTVGSTRYLILGLDVEPRKDTVDWAKQVIYHNSDCKVIITTHQYMFDGTEFLTRQSGGTACYNTGYNGQQLWDELFSQYSNIAMVLCGHVETADLQIREDTGVNGNKVISVLYDTQSLDYSSPSYNAVGLIKFSEDGSNVSFRAYSTTKNCYLSADSQIDTCIGAETSDIPQAAYRADYSKTAYCEPNIIRDYYTYVTDSSVNSIWDNDGKDALNASNSFSWSNDRLRVSLPNEFADSAAEKHIGLSFSKLPNTLAGDNYTALSIYVDFSESKKTNYLRIRFNPNSEKVSSCVETGNGGIAYLLPEDTEEPILQELTSNWSTATIPAGFRGTVIVPFDSYFKDGARLSAGDMVAAEQSNSAMIDMRILKAGPGEAYYINNITYLKDSKIPVPPQLEDNSFTMVKLAETEGYEYSTDLENWQSSGTFEGLNPEKEYFFYQRKAATADSPASEPSLPRVFACAPVIKLIGSNKVLIKAFDGYEYSIDNGATWQTSNLFENLDPKRTDYRIAQRKTAGKGYISQSSGTLGVIVNGIDSYEELNATTLAEVRKVLLFDTRIWAADINNDEQVDICDYIRLKKIIADKVS